MKWMFIFLLLFFRIWSQTVPRKGSLGVGLYNELHDSVIKKHLLNFKEGAVVKFVMPNSTAAQIGLKSYDVIVSCNAKPVTDYAALIKMVKGLNAEQPITVDVLRNNKPLTLTGNVKGKPYEVNPLADVVYGGFSYGNDNIRTIYKKPKTGNIKGVVYFVQGISCYSVDNMQASDPTKLALDAMLQQGFATYCVEKYGLGDSYNSIPCEEIGFDTELDVFRQGYKNLLNMKGIDTSQIFIFGHSLGGVSAPLLAQEFRPKGVVVYGTVLKPWADYLLDTFYDQPLLYGADRSELKEKVERVKPAFHEYFNKHVSLEELAKHNEYFSAFAENMEYNAKNGSTLAGRTAQFHREINDHPLDKAWAKTNAYVLAIYGEADIAAINPKGHQEIIDIINKKDKRKGTFLLMPKTNHTFQEVGTMSEFIKMQSDQAAYQTYASTHFNTKLFNIICDWMTDKTKKSL